MKPTAIYIITVAMILLCAGSASAWYDDAWEAREMITVTGGASGSQTDSQILLNVTYDSVMQTDFDDLRFTQSDDMTLIDAWLESKIDSGYAIIWVKIDTPASGVDNTIYMYYGNSGAASAWNGSTTFVQFRGAANTTFNDSAVVDPRTHVFEAKVRVTSSVHNIRWGLSNTIDGTDDYMGIVSSSSADLRYNYCRDNGTPTYIHEPPGFALDEWCRVTQYYDSGVPGVYGFVDGNQIGAYISTNVPNEDCGLWMYFYEGTGEQEWSFARKYVENPATCVFGDREIGVPMVIELLSQTPDDLFQNSTGYFNQTWGIQHTNPLNESAITMIYRNMYDGEPRHSLRMPGNDRATDGWRGANRNETGADRLVMEDVYDVFGGNYYNWSAGDIEHNVRMHLVNVDSTHTIIHFNDSVQMTTFPASWYLDRSEMIDAAKTEIGIYKHYSRLVKMYNNEMTLMNDNNYTVSIWIDTVDNGVSLTYPLSVWWANESFDPTGGVSIIDSPYAMQMGVITDTDWETRESFPHSNDYMRFSVYAGPGMKVQATSTGYLYFEYDYPQKFIMNCTDVTTSTNVSFADTGVMWTSDLGSSVYTPLAYTPNMFLTFHVANQTFQSQLWAMESTNVNLSASYIEETVIQQSSFAPGRAIFNHFAFMGFNDTTMDCVYRETVSPTLRTCGDPDGGVVSGNLTLCYSDGTHVAVINNTFESDTSEEFVFDFNMAPYYSTTDLYTLKLVCTDDENDVSTTWLPTDFALSPLATTGVLYNGKATSPRVLFWGINDIHTLYISVANTSRISYTGGIYTMHQAFHHGQYGDDFDFGESVRIVSRNDVTTPFYRFTGDNTFDYATVTSWNVSLGTPSPQTDVYRSYIYSDEYYSRVNITNSDISNLGAGEEPYAGMYIQNAEGALINNNLLAYNGEGITLRTGGNFTISNNTLSNPQEHTISMYDTYGNVTVRDNVIASTVETAGIIMCYGGSNNLFDNNTISDIVQSGFYFSYTSNTVVSDNIVVGAQRGVVLAQNCQNFTVTGNDVAVDEDAQGNPAWGMDVMSGTHNMSDNVLSVTDGYGFSIANYYTDIPCINSVMENNRVSTTSGTHPDAGTFVDYMFDFGTTGNTIRDPADTSNTVSIRSTDSVTIENTDNAVFTHAGNNHAVISNPGITQLVDDIGVYTFAQTSMSITPSAGTMDFYDFTWAEETAFTLDASDPVAHVEIDATRSEWMYNGMWLDVGGVFYDACDAGPTGHVEYNYTGGFAVSPLAFSIHERILEGWQALGEDTTESYTDLVMIIGVCVLIVIVGGVIIGLRSFAGEISPEILIIVAVAIGLGLLVLVTVVEIVPSVMQPMENITMEGL